MKVRGQGRESWEVHLRLWSEAGALLEKVDRLLLVGQVSLGNGDCWESQGQVGDNPKVKHCLDLVAQAFNPNIQKAGGSEFKASMVYIEKVKECGISVIVDS